jgi:hypothetical protein
MRLLAVCLVGIGIATVAAHAVDDWRDDASSTQRDDVPTSSCRSGGAAPNPKGASPPATQLTVEIAKLTRELSVANEVVRLLTAQLNAKTAELDAALTYERSCPRAAEFSPDDGTNEVGCLWGVTPSGCATATAAVCDADGLCSFVVCPNGGCSSTGHGDSFIVSTSLGSEWTHLTQVRCLIP